MSELSEDFVQRGFKINIINSLFLRAKERSRNSLLSQEKRGEVNNRVALVLNYHQALSKINGIIDSLCPVLHASDAMKIIVEARKCKKIYVGSNITPFRKRFNNHENSLIRYGKGQRGDIGRVFICSLFWSRT